MFQRCANRLVRPRVPDPRSVVVGHCHHARTVCAKLRRQYTVRVLERCAYWLTRQRVPDPRRVIIGRRHQAPAVGAEGRRSDNPPMLQRCARRLARPRVRGPGPSDHRTCMTTRVPSALNTADNTVLTCWSGAPTGWPVRASHIRACVTIRCRHDARAVGAESRPSDSARMLQ